MKHRDRTSYYSFNVGRSRGTCGIAVLFTRLQLELLLDGVAHETAVSEGFARSELDGHGLCVQFNLTQSAIGDERLDLV